jgi:hypothetical protein
MNPPVLIISIIQLSSLGLKIEEPLTGKPTFKGAKFDFNWLAAAGLFGMLYLTGATIWSLGPKNLMEGTYRLNFIIILLVKAIITNKFL